MTLKSSLSALIAAGFVMVMSCSTSNIAVAPGTGSETTNGFTATIVYPNGTPAAHAVVRLRPQDYLADTLSATGKALTSQGDVLTDEIGRFSIDSLDTGAYLIEATDAHGNAVAVRCVAYGDSVIDLGAQTLAPRGMIVGSAGGPFVRAFVRVRGLERSASLDVNGRFAVSVPAGVSYAVNIANADTSSEDTVSVPIDPAQTVEIHVEFGTYRTDSLAVRAFLDSCGLVAVPVELVTVIDSISGRIGALHLVHRNLSAIHPSIGALSFLNELFITNNPVTDLPPTIADLPHLLHLHLDSLPMTRLPDCVPRILSLRLLVIDYTPITTIPAALSNCTALGVFSMRGTGATEFPAVITAMPQLKALNISNNPIGMLPSSISACVNLEYLEIHDTQIDSLPSSIGELRRLRDLFAYRCRLTSLPSSIGMLTSLSVLNVGHNQLTSLPPEIGACVSLRILNIDYNALTSLPDSIVNLHSSIRVTAEVNKLCALSTAIANWLDIYAESNWQATQTCP